MVEVIRKSNQPLWASLKQEGRKLDGIELKVGWFETNKYEDGTPVAYVATIQEFGYPKGNIPPRPFMRPTITREENNWRHIIEIEALQIFAGKSTATKLFEILGLIASGDIGKSIAAVFTPPLSPITIANRKFKRADKKTKGALDKPLIDTGIMFETVTYKVNG